ncbi:MAG: hypothetical protein K2X03_24920 [Bryobacteraceae bacterium]|nr:hypothetical protein [Bryobacteraceae bacterium]
MIRQTILLACVTVSAAFSQGLTATSPLVPLPAATFGGSGIPNTAVAVQTISNGGNTIVLGLNATQRFAAQTVTNNGAGTFYGATGVSPNAPSTPANPLANWNFNFYIQALGPAPTNANVLGQYTFELLYDMDPANATPAASLGRVVIPTGVSNPLGTVQDSTNLGFDAFRVAIPGVLTPPLGYANPGGQDFNPNILGQYTFALRAFAGGVQIGEVVIHVNAVPNTSTLPNPEMSYQVRYLSNLNVGESSVNITNTGARGAQLAAGTNTSTTGSICVNAYVFSPDEQMVSCCSCPVTPNGLVSLSATSLVGNSLTPAVPTSVIVKLVSTIPLPGATGCTGSASAIRPLTPIPQPGQLATGMLAWATTYHNAGPGQPFAATSTPFAPATLSVLPTGGDDVSELGRLATLCTYINANGSGFGICRACRLGGLGAGRL